MENKKSVSDPGSNKESVALLCSLISEKASSLGYKNKIKSFSENFDTFVGFEGELSKLSSEKNLFVDTICATYRQVVFLGLDRSDAEDKGVLGFYNWQDKELKLSVIENADIWQIQGFIGENENVLLSQSGGYAENSCHVHRQYIYDVSKNEIKKVQDCSGCDAKADGTSYKCSSDFFEN